ncbi:MAG TPA: thiamine pyrophosphate-dependent enzyme, partial [Ilumatobacteraceae bacterium]
ALDVLVSGTPRPVAIEVPADVWAKAAPGTVGAGLRSMPSIDTAAIAAIDAAAAKLRAATNPLIWVGTGAQDAAPAVRQLAELLQAPVSTRRMGHGVMDETDPLFVPLGLAHSMWSDVDLVLGIGSRIEFPLLQWGTGGLDLIQVNTDARELDRHGIGALGVHGDAAEVVPMLIDRLSDLRRPDRRAEFASRRGEFFASIAHLEPQLSYLAAIHDALPEDAIIVEDVTQLTFVAHFGYQFRHPRTFLSTGFAGTLGSGTAVGIGAKAGAPQRTVVTITGDGGFLFTATELATAVQHHINAITIVVNDGAFGNVRRIQQERFGPERTIASTLVNPDIVAFAQSFGCLGLRADDPHALGDALKEAMAHDGPVVIEVPIGEVPSPWPFIVMPRVR